ncbi:hypothetical protein [Limnohabitans sp. Rim8]|jgi:hypothetical protein|uniref:hypothetical protein n=1 Tax=Limnohabitans sp. Rim8 TaxID=1100718 RepID=UPI00260BC008|nr:hypothetical protein [Limnohabitans sp. Rim8]
MLKLLLKMMLLPPELIKSHAQGYVDLASEVGSRYLCTLKNRWVMFALSALTLVLALIFGGVALMLWSTATQLDASQAAVLWGLPSTFLVISALLGWRAKSLRLPSLLQDIQSQLQLDLEVIRTADAP